MRQDYITWSTKLLHLKIHVVPAEWTIPNLPEGLVRGDKRNEGILCNIFVDKRTTYHKLSKLNLLQVNILITGSSSNISDHPERDCGR